MRIKKFLPALAIVCTTMFFPGKPLLAMPPTNHESQINSHSHEKKEQREPFNIQLGPRPWFLVEDMDEGELKQQLQQCSERPVQRSDFSIGHRGAALQFPEHTRESYLAAARMGAGVIECDVTFTKDRQLVCRHSQCDLHTTTNILSIPELAAKCSVPFSPAVIDPVTGLTVTPAQARCCTSDITLAEFRMLQGKMDSSNPHVTTVEEYMDATANFRTDLYAGRGTLMTHAESIALFRKLGVKMTPELKAPGVEMPFQGDYTQEIYAQQMIEEYRAAGVPAEKVFAQSFSLADVQYWIHHEPAFGRQAVYLDGRYSDENFNPADPATWSPTMDELAEQGVKILAPPIYVLLALDENGRIVPSAYARKAKQAGLELITWTLERSGFLAEGGGFYYQNVAEAINNDGDMLTVLDVLARDVGVIGVFSDWPATVTYYANCKGLK